MAEVTDFQGRTAAGPPPRTEARRLIRRVGDPVRKARETQGIPRRSCPKARACRPTKFKWRKLEAGEGNILIALLSRGRHPLDYRIEWLIGEKTPTSDLVPMTNCSAPPLPICPPGHVPCWPRNITRRGPSGCALGLRGPQIRPRENAGRAAGRALRRTQREYEDPADPYRGHGAVMPEAIRSRGPGALPPDHRHPFRMILDVAGASVSNPTPCPCSGIPHIWIKASPRITWTVSAPGRYPPMAGNPEAMATLRTIWKP